MGIPVQAQWVPKSGLRCFPEDGALPPNLANDLKKVKLRRTGTLGLSGRDIALKYEHVPPVPPEKLKVLLDMHFGGQIVAGKKDPTATPSTYDYRMLNLGGGLQSRGGLTSGSRPSR